MKVSEWIDGLSVHGVRHIFIGNKFSRIFWTIVIVASITCLLGLYYLLYLRLNKTPDINVRIKNRFTSEIPFPAITLCNPMFAKDSLVRYYNITRKSRINPNSDLNLTIQEQNYLSSNIQPCTPDSAIYFKSQVKNRTEHDVVKLLNQSSLSIKEAIAICIYRGIGVECSKVFNRVLTDRGICYSFNMQGFNTIFNEEIISKDFHSYKRTNIAKSLYVHSKFHSAKVHDENETFKWSIDHGYVDNHDPDVVPVKAVKRKIFAFNPFLKENDATNVCTVYGNVFSLFLHLPNEIMLPAHLETYVEFARKKDIILKAVSYTADDSMRKFTPKARGCYFEGEKQLKFFKTYTKSLCEFECMTNYTLKTCGCVKFSMPRTSNTPICQIEDAECYGQAMNNWPDDSKIRDRFELTCGCLKTCNDIKYDIKFDKLSTIENVIVISDILNISKSDVISRVTFTFEDFDIVEYEEYATYKLQNFVADVGGLLGFFLGCSILSIIEVVYFLLEICVYKLKSVFIGSGREDVRKLKINLGNQKDLHFIKSLKKVSDETYIHPIRLYQ